MTPNGFLDRPVAIGAALAGVRFTTPRRDQVGGAQERNASDYAQLSATLRTMGLMNRRRGWYLPRSLVLLGLLSV